MNHINKEIWENRKENHLFKIALIHCISALIICITLGLVLSKAIIELFKFQIPFITTNFIQVTPGEIFISSVEIAVIFGIILSAPIIIHNYIKLKIKPKTEQDKKFCYLIVILAFSAFILAVLFAYFVLIPIALYFLLGFNSGVASLNLVISNYVSFCIQIIFLTVLIFEIPVITYFSWKNKNYGSDFFLNYKRKILYGTFILGGALIFLNYITKILIISGIIWGIYRIFIILLGLIENKISAEKNNGKNQH